MVVEERAVEGEVVALRVEVPELGREDLLGLQLEARLVGPLRLRHELGAASRGAATGMPMYDSRKFGVRNAVATMPRMVDCLLG